MNHNFDAMVLMDILRGCGPRGLSGIPPVRDDRIIRPLIDLSRSQIDCLLSEKGLEWVIDGTNTDTRHLRNRIRHCLIPVLKSAYNPKIAEILHRLSRIMRSEEEWIDGLVESELARVLEREGDHQIVLSVSGLDRQHVAMKRRLVRRAIAGVKGNLERVALAHVEMVLALLDAGEAHRSIDLPDRLRVSYTEEGILFSREPVPLRTIPGAKHEKRSHSRRVFEYRLSKPGSLFVPEIKGYLGFSVIRGHNAPDGLPPGQQTAFLDMDSLEFPLTVRSVQPGDRFTPIGMGGSQKVNAYFIKQKIPRSRREKHPVVIDRGGRIIWVAGQRIDSAFRVVPSTRAVLKGELLLV